MKLGNVIATKWAVFRNNYEDVALHDTREQARSDLRQLQMDGEEGFRIGRIAVVPVKDAPRA